ncbi:MAG TPA: hypothetical protein VNO52_16440, partial [Methylomirabilota bacterium]|nr:hypothetical protein [Methylomirabilota bacterium]
MKRRLGGVSALAVAAVVAAQELPPGSAALRQRAQELLRAERWTEAAEQFRLYLQTGADDPATALDYAALLAQLNRREEAARALEAVRARHPRHEPVLFRLAAEYAALERWAE